MGCGNTLFDILFSRRVFEPIYIVNIKIQEKEPMSEKQEHRKRLNAKVEWIRAFEKWLHEEPSMVRVFKWRKWKKAKPNYEDFLKEA